MRHIWSFLLFLVFGLITTGLPSAAQDAPGATALRYTPVATCRVVDTRNANGQFGGPPISGGTFRTFPLALGGCHLPLGTTAYSLNVTVVPHTSNLHFLTVWPSGQPQPEVSTLNSVDGRTKANAAIVPSGDSGAAVNVYASDTTDVILDVSGYFTPVNGSNLAFFPLVPCRVVDTRGPIGPLGGPFLAAGHERDFAIQMATSCGIPPGAKHYSLNITAVPHGRLGYLTVWQAGLTQPLASTLNAPTGAVTANAAIVAAGSGGAIAVYPSNDTDLIVDINGYFGAAGQNGLSLYTVTPCRVLDTRNGGGAFTGQIAINVVGSPCAPSASAQAYVMNATVVPQGQLGYLTLWADGAEQPVVSTLNAYDGLTASNMAIVPTTNGSIDAFAQGTTNLIVDLFSYFAP